MSKKLNLKIFLSFLFISNFLYAASNEESPDFVELKKLKKLSANILQAEKRSLVLVLGFFTRRILIRKRLIHLKFLAFILERVSGFVA